METLQSNQVEASELFTAEWGFPALHPQLNQPNLVAAIVVMCAGAQPKWIMNWERFAESCFIPKFRTYSRKPNGDQNLSADEIVGYCLLAALACRLYDGLPYQLRRIIRTMKDHFGIYPNELGEVKLKRWMYRHIYLLPALKAGSGLPLKWYDRLSINLHLLQQELFQKKSNFTPDSLLKTWVMSEVFSSDKKCSGYFARWRETMKERGIGPRLIFTSHYMNEFPTMREIAPVDF